MHKSPKPVRKCRGCKLSLGDRCAVFPDPHARWKHGTFRGFQNEEMYQQHVAGLAKHHLKPGTELRRVHAKFAKTEPHHDGTLAHKTPIVDRSRRAR